MHLGYIGTGVAFCTRVPRQVAGAFKTLGLEREKEKKKMAEKRVLDEATSMLILPKKQASLQVSMNIGAVEVADVAIARYM